jgi:hypothetical protein
MLTGCIRAGEVAPLLQDAQLLAYVSEFLVAKITQTPLSIGGGMAQ